MRQPGIYALTGPGGQTVFDWTYTAERPVMSTNEHGFESCSLFVPATVSESFTIYDAVPGLHFIVSNGAETPFEGRIEDRRLVAGGVEVTAYGRQRAFHDVPYTGLWSDKHYAAWRTVTDDDRSSSQPEKWAIDNNNRTYVGLKLNETYANDSEYGELTYAAPHLGERGIVAFSASYSIDLPNNFQLRILTADYDFSSPTVVHTITSTGSPASSTIDITFTAAARLIVQVRNNTGSGYNNTSDTGTYFAKLTNVRVKTTTESTVLASDVASSLVSFVNGIDADQVRSNTALNVAISSLDLEDVIYEDRLPAAALTDLEKQAVADQRWTWAVWDDRYFHFYKRGERGLMLHADLVGLGISSTANTLVNSAYGTYTNGYGERERTAVSNDTISQSRYNLTRRVAVDGRSATQAQQLRDAELTDRAEISPEATVMIDSLTTEMGGELPMWFLRAGDTLLVRNVPIANNVATSKIRQFIVTATEYDFEQNEIRPSLEIAAPSVARMLGGG